MPDPAALPTNAPELAKAYEPAAVEARRYAEWIERGCFTADPARVSEKRPAYSIAIPPPNVTGILTLGHVLNNTIQDILARRARMLGKEVLWLPGTDHAGIATQNVVEKNLRKEGLMRHRDDLGREGLLAKIWEWKEQYGGIILQQLRALGCSCDWTRTRFTMDPEYSRCVQSVFVDLYQKGLIYRGLRMVNWCPATLTAVSDEEVEMREQRGFMYHFRVEVVKQSPDEPEQFLEIATTRPETIPGDVAVAVNPKDPRYAPLIGRTVRRALPLDDRAEIPIIGDDAIDIAFGTGVLKVTPAHDRTDYEIGQRHGLPAVDVLEPNGKMNALAGRDLAGLDRFEARKQAAELLREAGALVKEEPYVNNVGFSDRGGVPIEPRLSEQWFLRYPQTEKSRDVVADGAMRFYPERWAKVYDHWMGKLQDWCISRQLWWGHRIPVWYSRGYRRRDQVVQTVHLDRSPITGRNIRELRASAWQWARDHGLLVQAFSNLDTGEPIYIHRASLEHAFSNFGVVNVLLVPALPEILRHAVLVATVPHEPYSVDVRRVHRMVAALRLGGRLYRVKLTVKELPGGRRLYDHQSLELQEEKKVEPGGNKSPEGLLLAEVLPSRPAPGSERTLGELAGEVNGDPDFIRCQLDSPGDGWTQDPDVLDTWFSSWLWPFATMGWPEKTPTLAAFYPTTDLVTGPDIIFFWVARMIMAGFEYMGERPFSNVYFTGIIRDKQGRKMSKSLGNSPDPLALIQKFGADALRFGVMRSAPLGQDILFDDKNVELGRNFCTKLWNAARFRTMQGGEREAEIRPELLTSDEHWILLRLDVAVREVSLALDEYRFSDAAQALYRFFWTEFCDWHLEATKAALSAPEGDARRTNACAVLDFVLAHTLRLMHPFLPFITEELWHGLGYNDDLPAGQGGDTIMFARWPAPFSDEEKEYFGLTPEAAALAEAKHETVLAARGLRRDFAIAANQRVRFVLRRAAEARESLAPEESASLSVLLNAEPLELADPSWTPPAGTPSALTPLGELYLPLEGLVDPAAERARLDKEIAKAESERAQAEAKLADPKIAANAPPAVVEEFRRRAAEAAQRIQRLRDLRQALG